MKSKQITAGILTLAMGLTSAGMAMAAPAATGAQSAAKTQAAPATKADKKTAPAQKVTDPTLIKSLNHETAVPLLVEAEKRYFYALSGGTGTGELETFTENGKEYRYLSADIDTKDELLKYLMKSYTKQASEFFIKKFIIVHEGRLAQLNADTGNLLEFERATAKMISMTPTKRVYKINVPFPKEIKESSKYIVVKFEKVGDYWRVDTAPHLIF
ncbi:DL-endopeptidase inhibitor IseA family protein [Paenibacillus sp. SN-8-1]|uniref:DL-endopeptidase inhibitor IseA family protein n=1 Tax=Paenibacillus sp. SN-8-1 TaxID=3435409 RepID=UPI003D9A3624